jgi:glycine/D-amino acid oxidase-like deaminating enzyme
MDYDVIVVGNGVVGISAGLALRHLGVRRVAVLDRRSAAAGSSGLGAGSVTVQRFTRADVLLCERSQQLMREAERRSNGLFRLYPVGRITLVNRPEHEAILRQLGAWLDERAISHQFLAADAVEALFPGMHARDATLALFTPEDGYVRPPQLAWALTGMAREAGVHVLEGIEVTRVALSADGRVEGVLARGELLQAPRVILAANAWTKAILQASGLDLAQKVYRTQVAFVRTPENLRQPVVLDEVRGLYSLPRNPGSTLIGFGHAIIPDADATDTRVDAELEAAALEKYRARWPGAGATRPHGGWAGPCDETPDGNPYLGAYGGGVRGLTLACGFGGYGVMRGPSGGEVAAQLALGLEPAIDVGDYRADRFLGVRDFVALGGRGRPWEVPFGYAELR